MEGEHVYWLPPLASPAPNPSMKAADVIEFPAVKLFMERAAASGAWLDPSDADAAVIAGICGRLDGIALAIELAGGRVATQSIQGTADLLEKGLGLHWQGRRTAAGTRSGAPGDRPVGAGPFPYHKKEGDGCPRGCAARRPLNVDVRRHQSACSDKRLDLSSAKPLRRLT